MSLPREQKKSQSPWLDLAVFAGVLTFLGYSVHAFLGARAAPVVAVPKPEIGDLTNPHSRTPASQTSPSTVSSTEVLRLPCLHSPAPRSFSSSARLLQIHAPFCQDDSKHSDGWHGSNSASGEEIIVFVNSREKTLSTNFFALKEGVNEIVFVQDLGKGHSRTDRLKVTRKSEE